MTYRAVTLGDWVSGLELSDVPEMLVRKAKDHFLDTVGAGIVGDGRLPTRVAAEVYTAPGDVPLLIEGFPRTPLDAVRINAVAAHAAEIDDAEGCDHSGAVVVPVLLAVCQDGSVTGDDILTAMVAGYEVGRRVQSALGGYDAHNGSGWHSTATCGVFAAAAAASRVLRLGPEQTTNALGIAASASAGTWAFAEDGSMTKQLHVANAAAGGLQAALLALAGASGPRAVFDDVWGGFFASHGNDAAIPEELLVGLGERWVFEHSAVKMYAACRSAHPGIEGLVDLLREGAFRESDVDRMTIEVSPFLRPMICPERPRTVESARLSLPVSLALLLRGYHLGPDDYERYADAAVVEVLDRIAVVEAEDLQTPQTVRVTVSTESGEYSFSSDQARGSERLPFTTDEIQAKFRRLTVPRVGEGRARQIIDYVESLGPGPAGMLPLIR